MAVGVALVVAVVVARAVAVVRARVAVEIGMVRAVVGKWR